MEVGKMAKTIRPGTIVKVNGGKYKGHGAQVRKVNEETGRVTVMIGGKLVNLALERVTGG
jgi:transcription antitermination factor NusG